MAQREFEITVSPTGEVEVHIQGYKGKGCLEAARMFEKIVGEMQAQRETAEFYQPEENVRVNLGQKH